MHHDTPVLPEASVAADLLREAQAAADEAIASHSQDAATPTKLKEGQGIASFCSCMRTGGKARNPLLACKVVWTLWQSEAKLCEPTPGCHEHVLTCSQDMSDMVVSLDTCIKGARSSLPLCIACMRASEPCFRDDIQAPAQTAAQTSVRLQATVDYCQAGWQAAQLECSVS